MSGWTAMEDDGRVTVCGVLRLASPRAYDEVFAPVRRRIEAGEGVEVDLRRVEFMNSSGISAFARLVVLARRKAGPMRVVVDEGVAWQRKAIKTLAKLYPALEVASA
jgi:hypothetical protein